MKTKTFFTTNDTYVTEKLPEAVSQSQGFLSIIKINTRSNIQYDMAKSLEAKKSLRYLEERKENIRD